MERRGSGSSYGVLRVIGKAGDGGFNFGDDIFDRDSSWGWSKLRALLKEGTFRLPQKAVFEIN